MTTPSVPSRLILNGKKAGLEEVRDAVAAVRAAGHGLEVRVTWEAGDAARLVAEAARDGVPRVVAGGGDGSVNEVANGLMALPATDRPALGVLPLGTANDFATACRIPISTAAALRLALEAEPRPVDVAAVNDRFFMNVASAGFGAAVTAETPVELKNFLGGGAYTIMGLLKAIDFHPYACSIRTAAGSVDGAVVVGAVCNCRQAGGGQQLAPRALLDDGLLDVVFLRPFPVHSAHRVAEEIAEMRDTAEFVVRLRVPWLEVVAHDPIPVNLDGEPTHAAAYRFEAVPGGLRMALPEDCPCIGRGA